MESEHPPCPACHADMNGGLIWQTFKDKGETDEECDRIALMYGATRTSGQWGRAIALYDREEDRTVAHRCPDCNHEWKRT